MFERRKKAKVLVPGARIELARGIAPRDFKSLASTYSAIQALVLPYLPRGTLSRWAVAATASGGGLPEILGGLFRGGGVDVEARAPFEPGHLGQSGYDLQVPVVVCIVGIPERGGMDNEVVGGIFQYPIQPAQDPEEDLG